MADKYIVKVRFQDAPEYIKDGQVKAYEIGDDVSKLDAARLKKLVDREIVEIQKAADDKSGKSEKDKK